MEKVSGLLGLIKRRASLAATTKSILARISPLKKLLQLRQDICCERLLEIIPQHLWALWWSHSKWWIFFGQSDPTEDLLLWVIVLVYRPTPTELSVADSHPDIILQSWTLCTVRRISQGHCPKLSFLTGSTQQETVCFSCCLVWVREPPGWPLAVKSLGY